MEQIKVRGCANSYAIHEKMVDGSWRTYYDTQFPGTQEIVVPLRQPLWPLPSEPINYGSDHELFKEVCEFIQYHLEIRERCYYNVMGCFVLMTWRIDEFDAVPYLDILGPKNTGKTRALEILAQLCFRGWAITHPTPAVVFWVVDRYCPTLLADNYEFWPKETRNELEGLFNAGYRRGAVVPRRPREGDSSSGLILYNVFSPKVLAGTRQPSDPLASRCITIRMIRNQREIPLKIDLGWAQTLRSKLLSYRFQKFEERNMYATTVMNPHARVGEIFYPLLEVAPSEEILSEISDFAYGVFQEQREEEASSIEAEVVQSIVTNLHQVEGDRLPIKVIVDTVNSERDEKERIRPQRLGWILARLGFKKTRMPDAKGNYAIVVDRDLIERLAENYDVKRTVTASMSPKSCSDAQLLRSRIEGSTLGSEHSEQLSKREVTKEAVGKQTINNYTKHGIDCLHSSHNFSSKFKDICGFCWRNKGYDILESKGRVMKLSRVSYGKCQDCGKEIAEIRIGIVQDIMSSGT
ncbi:MAG: hypothetical protein QXH16_09120 [Candidatus Bathyarchaeia archaeon]